MNRLIRNLTIAAILLGYPPGAQIYGQPRPVAPVLTSQSVWPHLRPFLTGVGDRLVAKGKERNTLIGTIRRGSCGADSPIRVVHEFPGRLRVEEQGPSGQRVTGFDGKAPWAGAGTVSASDADLLETLLHDTAEHFFLGQASGAPTRFYGSGFRMDDGKNRNYQGPYYDVYEVGDLVSLGSQPIRRTKIYCLNTQTLVLERVHYNIGRPGAVSRVEVLLSGWKKFDGYDVFPQNVTRSLNGLNVFTISLQSATAGPRSDDGMFSPGR